ncbi:MAG: SDR family NAD(P)-dependent oxidoreductase [Rhodospirillales bacterium]|nr:SDR family NAD(P)-dependent oxidoreductase [Rhodospirillales bacterium]
MSKPETAIVVGVGPGLGLALVKTFAEAGMAVAMAARNKEHLAAFETGDLGDRIRAYPCDSTDSNSVTALFDRASAELGEPDVVVYNAGAFQPGSILDIAAEEFERCWKVGCLGGFLVGQAAARRMVPRGAGTILFTGATAALRGSARFANLAVPKFGLRALAQSMARELGPQGIHVAHVVIDGQIDSERSHHLLEERGADSLLAPGDIAGSYLHLHRQAKSAWTQELDLRPWVEKF